MKQEYDSGCTVKKFRRLFEEYPGAETYPKDNFRIEWGPMFYRGRLDGSARILVIGQDPAQHETIVRRILVGEAGQRVQGFLAKLGIDRSYVMVNAFLYSVYGSIKSEHSKSAAVIKYRNLWLDAILLGSNVEAVVTFGTFARQAWESWVPTHPKIAARLACASVTHPTFPESSSGGDKTKYAAAMQKMLADWNSALLKLKPALTQPDRKTELVPYGTSLAPDDLVEIPAVDYPAGLPEWMRGLAAWASRTGASPALKRVTIEVQIPTAYRP